MKTLTELADQTGIEVYDHLVADAEVPVIAGIQAQGDLLVAPTTLVKGRRYPTPTTPVPATGVELLRGQHPHVLVADPGTCHYDPLTGGGVDLAVIEATAPVHLLHPEHGAAGVAPGRYVVRRQREMADQQRLVAD